MLVRVTPAQRSAILRAMATVATGDGRHPLSQADRTALIAANHVVFGAADEIDPGALSPIAPPALAAALADDDQAESAAMFLTVMALVDGTLDDDRLASLQSFAAALGVHQDFLLDLAEAARGHLAWAAADMSRQNVVSVTHGRVTDIADFELWPYRERGGDAALLQRFEDLAHLADGTLGREFLRWYRDHDFALPGAPDALNAEFVVPHDSLHLLSGYSTSPQGELLVSTFTAGTLGGDAFGAHILPVMFSFHLGIQLNPLAGAYRGSLEPEKFWIAWDRGRATTVDCFDPAWDFWRDAPVPLEQLRRRYTIPPLSDPSTPAPVSP